MSFAPEPRICAKCGSGTSKSSRSKAMRKAFDRQRRPDCPSVTKVPLNLHCRNETVPILRALQHIYGRAEVRDPILHAIVRPRLSQPEKPRGVGQDHPASLSADVRSPSGGPAIEDGERRVPPVASGSRIGDRRAGVRQRAGALPRPDGAGIRTLYRSGRVGPESSRAG
jgi:hypothetical protein